MKVLATNILSDSVYHPIIDSLYNQYHIYHFEDDKKNLNQESFRVFTGQLNDIHFFEDCVNQVDAILFFIERPVNEDESLRNLLDKIKLVLDVGIQHNKKLIFLSDSHKELISITDIQNDGEWRSNSQHSNWVRFQYLVEQEVERAIAENTEVTIVWHTPLIQKIELDSDMKIRSYSLHTYEEDLFSILVRLLNGNEKWKNKYILLGKAFPSNKPIYFVPKKKSWFQNLFSTKIEREWNVVSESILKNDLINNSNIILEKTKPSSD